ncbi:MAG: DUF5130 family protein [Burkholderiaceae bacterium]|jgi:uncharacterized membrane protein|nr:DUF5130 family protein [Burkholderiaceae bacterium]
MTVGRWLRHWFTTPRAVRRAFPAESLARIERAIDAAEQGHSGEIRFAVEAALPWSYLKRQAPARERALMVFAKLRVWDTENNNGVLIYVELADRSIEIVADRDIARRVPAAQWQAIATAMREQFRAGRFEDGVIAAVDAVAQRLRTHYPLADGARNPDELANRPAVL